jgi:hypothetical protein
MRKLGQPSGREMREERSGALRQTAADEADDAAAVQWQRTLWVMVGIQFIMTGAFSVLSPTMPLLLPELGVEAASAVDLWAGILNAKTLVPSGETRDVHRAGGHYVTLVGSNPRFDLPEDRWPHAVDADAVTRLAAAVAAAA